ncbi:U3 small nucleolar RNA-associated protein NOL7-like [Heterodontus francisci]|uniref:U3 small nucleolar RNA-associated protein NOL7-like n=1 Tax=Heterodontus francisci TaxID=7792 RepID=UPI00355B5414
MAWKRPVGSVKSQESREMSAEISPEDEAPEEVTFSSAREEAEKSMKVALDSVRRDKALLKEKRRRKEQLFKEQKKRKLLPDGILEEITSVLEKNDQAPDSSKEGDDCNSVQQPEEDSGLEEDVEECVDTRWKESYMAIRLKDQGQTNQQVENARDFINDRLYGPGSRRGSVNEYFSLANKKAQKKKPAMQFVNKSWGAQQKQKSGKFRKLWIQHHGVTGR